MVNFQKGGDNLSPPFDFQLSHKIGQLNSNQLTTKCNQLNKPKRYKL